MTKQMLGKLEGEDFNMAFLGQPFVALTMILAELKAVESEGPTELRTFATQAIPNVEKHIESAKQSAKKLQDERKSRS